LQYAWVSCPGRSHGACHLVLLLTFIAPPFQAWWNEPTIDV